MALQPMRPFHIKQQNGYIWKGFFANKKQLLVTIADLSTEWKSITQLSYGKLIFAPYTMGFSGGSEVKNLPANAGDMGSITGLGRSPGEGNGNALQYSCLEDPMDRGAWWATANEVAKSEMT